MEKSKTLFFYTILYYTQPNKDATHVMLPHVHHVLSSLPFKRDGSPLLPPSRFSK
ncbi:hypothetical protein YC2023_008063 [Brassica napus]